MENLLNDIHDAIKYMDDLNHNLIKDSDKIKKIDITIGNRKVDLLLNATVFQSVYKALNEIKSETERESQKSDSTAKKRVCGYARVAHPTDNHTLPLQTEIIKNTVDANPDWKLKCVYKDVGLSRTERDKMLDACRNGEIDIIITKNPSRLERDTVKFLKILNELNTLGVDVYFIENGFHTQSKGWMSLFDALYKEWVVNGSADKAKRVTWKR